jgi:hypothetical protein
VFVKAVRNQYNFIVLRSYVYAVISLPTVYEAPAIIIKNSKQWDSYEVYLRGHLDSNWLGMGGIDMAEQNPRQPSGIPKLNVAHKMV